MGKFGGIENKPKSVFCGTLDTIVKHSGWLSILDIHMFSIIQFSKF